MLLFRKKKTRHNVLPIIKVENIESSLKKLQEGHRNKKRIYNNFGMFLKSEGIETGVPKVYEPRFIRLKKIPIVRLEKRAEPIEISGTYIQNSKPKTLFDTGIEHNNMTLYRITKPNNK